MSRMSVLLRGCWLALVAAAVAPALQGCVPLVAAGAVGTGALIAEDRRTSGTYLDDEGIEIKAVARINEKFPDDTHVNATSYNKVVLLTGEVPSEEVRRQVGDIARGIEGVRIVDNELAVGPVSSLSARSSDTYTTSRVKTRFIDARKFQVNHVKVVTEAGVVYLMGLVTREEARDASEIASTTPDVKKVVTLFEYIQAPKENQ
ncbi:MAG: BON domain-containing protein [Betaproteobacteria bacterium]|nr:BON domain-containing protein [Betaproteobacteria bacterium]